jgi:hypothetical protein
MATNLTTATDTLEVKTNFRGVQTARDGWNCQRPHLQEGAQRAYSLKNSVGDEFDAPTAPHTIDAYYRRGTHEEGEASMAPWLRKTIDELERKRQSSTQAHELQVDEVTTPQARALSADRQFSRREKKEMHI